MSERMCAVCGVEEEVIGVCLYRIHNIDLCATHGAIVLTEIAADKKKRAWDIVQRLFKELHPDIPRNMMIELKESMIENVKRWAKKGDETPDQFIAKAIEYYIMYLDDLS